GERAGRDVERPSAMSSRCTPSKNCAGMRHIATPATRCSRDGDLLPRRGMVLHQGARSVMRVTLSAAILCAIVGCTSSPAAEKPPQRPPPEVGVVTLKTEPVTLQTELAGRTVASLASELRPQVSGIVKARTFEEGARVKAGQVLYEIDPAMYRAAYQEAAANLSSARAALEAAKLKDERFAGLAKIEGVSKQEAEDARAAHQLAVSGGAARAGAA